MKLRLPSFIWHKVDGEGYHPGLFGNYRYAKRLTLIKEGLERVESDGFLHLLSTSNMASVSTSLAEFMKKPLLYTEIPSLVNGTAIRTTDKVKEMLEDLACEINAIDEARGRKVPLAESYVFRDNVGATARAAAIKKKIPRVNKTSMDNTPNSAPLTLEMVTEKPPLCS